MGRGIFIKRKKVLFWRMKLYMVLILDTVQDEFSIYKGQRNLSLLFCQNFWWKGGKT